MNIVAACAHTGGANAVLPVVRALRSLGHSVQVAACGEPAAQTLNKEKEGFYRCNSPIEVFGESSNLDLYITSMCDVGLGEAVVQIKNQFPHLLVVALQDIWYSGLAQGWREAASWPDYVVANDTVGRDLLLEAWSGFPAERIQVLGFPSLDRYAAINQENISQETRSRLGMTEPWPVVLFAGQTQGAIEELNEFVSALNKINRDVYVLALPHPRMEAEVPGSTKLWNESLSKLQAKIPAAEKEGVQDLVAAATAVIARTSTILLEAAALGKQAISIFYPEEGVAAYFKESGLDQFPLVKLGCAAQARDFSELCTLLQQAMEETLELKEAQEKHLSSDRQSAQRIAEFIVELA